MKPGQKERFLRRNKILHGLRETIPRVLGSGTKLYEVYYAKNPRFLCPPKFNITDYRHVINLEADNLDQVFHYMQAEIWSRNGEAKPLIQELDLNHTSMSVGDIIKEQYFNGKEWVVVWSMVDILGFKEVKC